MNNVFYLICLLLFPLSAHASDPTPLVEIFIEWPLLFLSGILFFIAFLELRNSLFANIIFFLFQLLVLWWLVSAEYMKDNGDIIWLSLFINAIGVGFGIFKISSRKSESE